MEAALLDLLEFPDYQLVLRDSLSSRLAKLELCRKQKRLDAIKICEGKFRARVLAERQGAPKHKEQETQTPTVHTVDVGVSTTPLDLREVGPMLYHDDDESTQMCSTIKSETLSLFIEKYWEIEFLTSQENYDSDPFEFGGTLWRLNFSVNERSTGNDGWKFLLSPIQSVVAQIHCEFRIHCLLRPSYCRVYDAVFDEDSYWQGIESFIGHDVLAYVEQGRQLTLSVKLFSRLGTNISLISV